MNALNERAVYIPIEEEEKEVEKEERGRKRRRGEGCGYELAGAILLRGPFQS